jgi:arylsulfatase A-like enzyme
MHCQVALCTPSRTSILTGIRPSTSGIVKIDDDWKKILPNAVSLPRHFRNHGYHTHAIGKISDPRDGGSDSAWVIRKEEWGIESNDLVLPALKEMEKAAGPFFLAIGYKQTHDPWTPADRFRDLYPVDGISLRGTAESYKKKTLSVPERKKLLSSYYGEISEVDSLVGQVLDSLKSMKYYDNTVILLGVMDHGYSLGYHGKWGKGGLYDTQTQVPFMVRHPGNSQHGKRIEAITELVDIYPSLVDICKLPLPPQKLEGRSFLPLLKDPDILWKKAAFVSNAYHLENTGIKTREYCFIYRQGEYPELYFRPDDPTNQVNIADRHPEIVSDFMDLLKEDPSNHLLMHAMAPNVSGVIGSAVAAGILLSFLL